MTLTIVNFIEARLGEEEQRGREPEHYHCEDCWYSCPKAVESCGSSRTGSDECDCNAEREATAILTRVEALRTMLRVHRETSGWGPDSSWPQEPYGLWKCLAAIWSWHPDYNPAWAPG